ncbi:hypothetical protein KIN20_033524 [Parelaphostrongylus tenuis]|uniref:Gamma-interferon-inducible lysosomal thiol reductase n=1 Tax=Parelaphostrongylus tenuis TaxID=148309 RepID=A0AAD5WIY1_PARTN|nr:hypothetical protein KIN20_033524 [Parelaphostrongylus tenuis]
MMLALLLLGFSAVSADRCASVPSALWCTNDELSKQCGVENQCNKAETDGWLIWNNKHTLLDASIYHRYNLTTFNKTINITVLIEGLCPYCEKWIVEELYPNIYENFAEVINIEFVPFGNAKNKNGTITCQHGEEECRINRFESCLIHSKVPFENATAECYRNQSIREEVQGKIQSCVHSHLGDELQQEAAEKTANVWPLKHYWVPWIIVNGVSVERTQAMLHSLPYYLCEWYIGGHDIPYCSLIAKAKSLENLQTYHDLSM